MKKLRKPGDCESIEEIRDALDEIDQEIINLFSRRQEYVKEIVKFKGANEMDIVARERRDQVLSERKAWAEAMGLDGKLMEKVFRILIDKNIQIQFDLHKSNTQ